MTLDDIVLQRFADPLPIRLSRYFSTFFDYVFSGTAQKFIHHAWRFSLYFFYPAFMILLTVAMSLFIAMLIGASNMPYSWGVAIVAFFATLATLIKLGSKRYFVLHLMDLWSFSRDFIHENQHDMNQKLDALASQIVSAALTEKYDEIILIGHSTGGALILDAAGRAFEKNTSFGEGHTKVHVLTVGSTALKIGLHPAAGWFRDRLANVFSSSSVRWAEYQCVSDIINFYRSKPADLMGFGDKCRNHPFIDRVRLSRMIAEPAYSRMKWYHFFRIHYQFVFGNTLKYQYDYPAIILGPSSLADRTQRPLDFNLSITGITNTKKETE